MALPASAAKSGGDVATTTSGFSFKRNVAAGAEIRKDAWLMIRFSTRSFGVA
jgi:hypothetical protein